VLGQGIVRVGAGRYQGRREEVPDAHAVVGVEADVAVDGAGVGGCLLRDGYLLVQVDILVQCHEGDHDLGRRSYRDPLVRVLARQVVACVGVDERPGTGVQLRCPRRRLGLRLLGRGPIGRRYR
jgi:hypothetical protein